MKERVHKARRITGIAIGVVRAIFNAGRRWGTARTRVRTARRPELNAPPASGVVAGAAAGAAGAYFLDPQNGKRRRHVVIDRAKALTRRGANT